VIVLGCKHSLCEVYSVGEDYPIPFGTGALGVIDRKDFQNLKDRAVGRVISMRLILYEGCNGII